MKIGIVTSRFNSEVTELLEKGALDYLDQLQGEIEILSVRVPGAVEIPLACQALFDQGCDGVVALGAVIRGETSHYDYVCTSVERGITHLMLDVRKPIGFGVLTTENEEQAMDRAGGNHGNKGAEAAQVVIEMIGLLTDIQNVGASLKMELDGHQDDIKGKGGAKSSNKSSNKSVSKKTKNQKNKKSKK